MRGNKKINSDQIRAEQWTTFVRHLFEVAPHGAEGSVQDF